MKEYLYVDERRLNSYLGQFSSLVIYDRIIRWRSTLGLQPSVGGEIDHVQRELNLHEKITALQHKLKKSKQLAELGKLKTIGLSFKNEINFYSMHFAARRALIPPSSADEQARGISLWYAILPQQSPIFLLEDFPRRDSRMPFTTSTYTILRILLRDVERELKQTILGKYMDTPQGIDKLTQEFAKDPVSNLTKLGAEFSDERIIWALFRVRAIFREGAYGNNPAHGWTVFGYPIVITEETIGVTYV